MSQDLKYWVWLSTIPKVGAVRAKQLLEHFGNPKNLWDSSEKELREISVPPSIIKVLLDEKLRVSIEAHIAAMSSLNIEIITLESKMYPNYLKNIYAPPVALYVKGKFEPHEKYLAVVGSRKASPYGVDIAERISYQLTKCGITIVSGMARGIDSFAHNGALSAGGRTIAVLGCGLDTVYPQENKGLMERIIKNGAVVSEYIPGVPPLSQNFPARNRIISGMSMGVIVVEASEKSGSLITANFALDQGREVFAIPGNLNSSNSKGTNKLIREGAKIITGIEDVLEELKAFDSVNNINYTAECSNNVKLKFSNLNDEEVRIAQCICDGSLHIDKIAEISGLSTQAVNSLLVIMELKGIVQQMPGKLFRLKE